MKTLWLIPFIIVLLDLLATSPSFANEARLQHLVTQGKAAIARGDHQEEERIINEIFKLTTGLAPDFEETPEHQSNADYQNKLCPYRKAIASLMTDQDILYLHHKSRFAAFRIVYRKEENKPYVLTIIKCTHDNGTPVPDSIALKNGIEWALKIRTADIAELRTMGQEYEKLLKHQPNAQLYQLLDTIIDLEIDGRHLDNLSQQADQLLNEGLFYQARLVEKADKGNLAAQMEVAQRLETGDKFRQDNAAAYFWYKRALDNNGGKAAQSGLDRLLPHLSEIDFLLSIDIWTRNNHRPY